MTDCLYRFKRYFKNLKFVTYLRFSRYSWIPRYNNNKARCCVVQFIDGATYHGGMSDRIRSIISVYALSKAIGMDYKLYYTSPFNMEQYLLPNITNWHIDKETISFNVWDTQLFFVKRYLYRRLPILLKKQVHIYAHCDVLDQINKLYHTNYSFTNLFNELFIPNTRILNKMDEYMALLGGRYDAIVFRFQNSLGDFFEGNFKKVDRSNKCRLIHKCLDYLTSFCSARLSSKVLLTSDSHMFLDLAKEAIGNLFVIPGELVHMQYCEMHTNYELHEKPFLDFYMLTYY